MLPENISAVLPRLSWPRSTGLRVGTLLIALFIPAPVLAILYIAFFGESQSAPLSNDALFDYFSQTAVYAGGSTLLAIAIALPAAWLSVMRRLPGGRMAAWALFLPFALPPYVTAYAYADFFDFAALPFLGMTSAVIINALALYPYVYFFARAALRQQPCHIQSAARLMGHSPLAIFARVSWPLARPAVAVGAALALMETLNDIAIAEHYGIRALGAAVYDLWLNRGDLRASCRLASLMLILVAALAALENMGRNRQRQYILHCDRCFECERAPKIGGFAGGFLLAVILLPAVGGFFLPLGWLLFLTLDTPTELWAGALGDGLSGSLLLSLLLIVALAVAASALVLDKRINGHGILMSALAKLSQCGYALPGAVLAQGFFVLAAFSGGHVVIFGGLGLILAACCTRFFLIAVGALESGMNKIPPQMDIAAKLAKRGTAAVFFGIHLPLLRPTAAAAVMILLEGFKELPMTLILRPFNFDTLATVVYQYASDEALELAAPAAVVMALIGVIAVSVIFFMEGRDIRIQEPLKGLK